MCTHPSLCVSITYIQTRDDSVSCTQSAITWKTLLAGLKMPVLNSTRRRTTQKKQKEKKPQRNNPKRNGALWKSEAFCKALEALNQTTKFVFFVFSDHFIHHLQHFIIFKMTQIYKMLNCFLNRSYIVSGLRTQAVQPISRWNNLHAQNSLLISTVLTHLVKDMRPSYNSCQKLLENNMQNQHYHRITEWLILRLLEII